MIISLIIECFCYPAMKCKVVSTHKVHAVCVSISGQLQGPIVWSWLTWWQLFFLIPSCRIVRIFTFVLRLLKKQKNSKEKVSFWAPFHRLPTLHLKSRIMKVQPCTEGAPLPPFYMFSLDTCKWRLFKQPSATSGGSHDVCTKASMFVCVFLFQPCELTWFSRVPPAQRK